MDKPIIRYIFKKKVCIDKLDQTMKNLKNNMLLTNELFNTIWDKAKDSVRHRMHFDLRDSETNDSQRMLNVLEIDTKFLYIDTEIRLKW